MLWAVFLLFFGHAFALLPLATTLLSACSSRRPLSFLGRSIVTAKAVNVLSWRAGIASTRVVFTPHFSVTLSAAFTTVHIDVCIHYDLRRSKYLLSLVMMHADRSEAMSANSTSAYMPVRNVVTARRTHQDHGFAPAARVVVEVMVMVAPYTMFHDQMGPSMMAVPIILEGGVPQVTAPTRHCQRQQ